MGNANTTSSLDGGAKSLISVFENQQKVAPSTLQLAVLQDAVEVEYLMKLSESHGAFFLNENKIHFSYDVPHKKSNCRRKKPLR